MPFFWITSKTLSKTIDAHAYSSIKHKTNQIFFAHRNSRFVGFLKHKKNISQAAWNLSETFQIHFWIEKIFLKSLSDADKTWHYRYLANIIIIKLVFINENKTEMLKSS